MYTNFRLKKIGKIQNSSVSSKLKNNLKLSSVITISTIIQTMFLMIIVLNNFIANKYFANILTMLIGICAYVYLLLSEKSRPLLTRVISIPIIFTIFGLISSAYNNNLDLQEVLWLFSYWGIAWLFYKYPNTKNIRAILYLTILYFLLQMIKDISPDHLFVGTSRNSISLINIFLLILFYYIYYINNKKISYFPSAFIVLICMWAEGRAGIISSIIIMISIILFEFKKENTKLKNVFLVTIIVILFVFILFLLRDNIIYYLNYFNSRGLKSGRTAIWSEYLNGVIDSIKNFVLGAPSIKYPLMTRYKGNLHNSFLILHSKFGLGGLIFFLYLIGSSFKDKKKEPFYFFCLIFITVRSFFDWTSFCGMYDVLWYILMLPKKKSN